VIVSKGNTKLQEDEKEKEEKRTSRREIGSVSGAPFLPGKPPDGGEKRKFATFYGEGGRGKRSKTFSTRKRLTSTARVRSSTPKSGVEEETDHVGIIPHRLQ